MSWWIKYLCYSKGKVCTIRLILDSKIANYSIQPLVYQEQTNRQVRKHKMLYFNDRVTTKIVYRHDPNVKTDHKVTIFDIVLLTLKRL